MNNRVREYRLRAGYSQAELASFAGVSRQSVSLVETGQSVPSALVALRLARALGTTVEHLFGEEPTLPEHTEPSASGLGDTPAPGDRVILCQTGTAGRFVRRLDWPAIDLWPTARATGVVKERIAAGAVSVMRKEPDTWNPTVLVAGCDIGIGLLTAAAHSRAGQDGILAWRIADNRLALHELNLGLVNVAAVHGPAPDRAQAEWRMDALPGIVRVHFAGWRMGWVTRPGAGFAGAGDFACRRFRLVNRPPGAGARALLDVELNRAGVSPADVPGYEWRASGHLQVAHAVAEGGADAGIAMESAAVRFGLTFLPLQEECCDLWIPTRELLQDPVQRLLDVLATDAFRGDLAGFGPYDVQRTGERMGEIRS